jgi:gliding motility-associated-like protein
MLCKGLTGHSQTCPDNIDFENGNFDGWTCYTGYVSGLGFNQISLTPSSGPVPDRHTMYSSFPGDGLDHYGGFPINCPNGSGNSIRLGNTSGGGEAEGISYEFTIPANQNYYTLIYNYAVVFQDPDHQEFEQPRMEIKVTNETDNAIIHCSSFTFIPYGNILPGFFESPNPGTETPVWCKDWTAVSINLDGHAGKKIKLFFQTADCTFRRHFGYAYIDVNSECSGTFTGATFCPDDTVVNVFAPYGYQAYTWYNNSFSQILGNQQVLSLSPLPAAGTTIAVELVPYNGYGCLDTLYALLLDTLTVTANAGADALSCNNNPIPLGVPPRPGLVYHWTPSNGLTSPAIANPHAAPDVTTTYVVTTNHDGGGCIDRDTVLVQASVIDNSLELIGKPAWCIGSGDSTRLLLQHTDSIQWYKDDIPISGAEFTTYNVTQTGVYHAMLYDDIGCILSTERQPVNISTIPVPGVNTGPEVQCFVGNRFVFANTSTNAIGAMQYNWSLGDGTFTSLQNVTHSYPRAGNYNVKMIVSTNTICKDSSEFSIIVHPNAVAEFDISTTCIDMPAKVLNNTRDTLGSPLNYLWKFGGSVVSDLREPPPQVFTAPGTYQVSLSVSTDQCPTPLHTLSKSFVVEQPAKAIGYPVKYALVDYPIVLEARELGDSVLWNPGTWLDSRTSFNPIFSSSIPEQLYTIAIKSPSGCVTVDTQLVRSVKDVALHVPTAFTPNGDGRNDYLRPTIMGVKEIKYFRVFNRWGQMVFQSKNELPGWDGNINGTLQASQVYVWVIEGVGFDDRAYRRKGTCTLIR